ncbi:MAG: hypothetical protein LIO77_07960 [Rikenellaceae bacterium]|nr:hypothetical protein [Rikenellaceae bacterium]
MRGGEVIKTIFFGVSPILSLPGAFMSVYKKSRLGINLIAIFIGILSFIYLPHLSNDRARYFELYEFCRDASFKAFLGYLQSRPDFLLHSIIYLFAKIGIPVQFLFMGIAIFTVKMVFWNFPLIS